MPLQETMSSIEGPTKEMRAAKRILVAEDHEYSARICCDFLRVWGFAFERVSNGLEAVAAYGEQAFDVVLMDVMMPEMNGYDATLQIVGNASANRPPYIIGMTGNSLKEDLERCREVGIRKVMVKPVDFDQLRVLLDEALFPAANSRGQGSFVHTLEKPGGPLSSNVIDLTVANAFVERMSNATSVSENPLDAFSRSVEECLETLGKAVANEQREEIENCAHNLKSLAALVGARDLRDLSSGLENAAMKGGSNFRPLHWVALINDAAKAARQVLMPSLDN